MRDRRTIRYVLLGSVLLLPSTARAVEPEVTSETSAQFYEMRSPSGETVIARRRLVTTLGVGVYDLMDKVEDPTAPSLVFRARLRYDADYGGGSAGTDVTNYGRFVPGFERGPVDLMYGYLEGRRFLNGWLGFKLGRQYQVDSLGWWSFDGGLVKITTPAYVSAEVYAGLEQRGGMPLSTPRFERDGVWRGDRSGYDPLEWPAFQPDDVAPAYGFAIESTGFTWLHGRLSYRRVYDEGASNVSEFSNGLIQPVTYDGARISSERLGYAVDGTIAKIGGFKAGLNYDLYSARFGSIFGSIDGYVSKRVTVGVDYDYYMPTFDGDSIWNFFMAMPMNDLGLRSEWDVTDHVAVSGGVHGRLYTLQTGPEQGLTEPTSPNVADADFFPSSKFQAQGGGELSARYRMGEGELGAHGAYDTGDGGDRAGVDLYGQRTLETRYVLSARTGVWQWKDDLRTDRDAVSFQYVLGAGYKILPRSLAYAEFEHDMNRLSGQRFRLMLWLSLAVAK